jgi:hypothetical protein
MRYVVEEVNEKRMSKEDASECILTVHLLDKTNTRVNDNLATLLSLLMQEYAQEGRSTALTSIKNILSKTRSCDSSLDNDLVEQLAILALISDHEDRLSAISSGISSYSSGTSTFAQKLNAKVTEVKVNKELNEIVERVNNNSINKSQALTKALSFCANVEVPLEYELIPEDIADRRSSWSDIRAKIASCSTRSLSNDESQLLVLLNMFLIDVNAVLLPS